MTVFNRPINNIVNIEVPKGGIKPLKAWFLADGKPVEIKSAGLNKFNANLWHFVIPAKYKSDKPFVIVFEYEDESKQGEAYQQAKI